ncbi:MAG: HAMP domain-containing histidine kinase [Ruminococcaceae bacterium]|nr:HAMP domain-containing histidine kinase [Oscillospiraceae bacterium]
MKKHMKRFQSLYWQQFLLTAGTVMLALVLMGVSFYALSYNYIVREKYQEMHDRAEVVAQLSMPYLESIRNSDKQDETLQRLAGVASLMSETDFLIADKTGQVLLTTDASLAGKSIRLPQQITQEILSKPEGYQGRSNLDIYDRKQVVVGVTMAAPGSTQPVGMVLAMMNVTALTEMWETFAALLLMTSAIVLMLAFIASSLMSMRQSQPVSEMVKATRAYAAGNFDVRMHDIDRTDEFGELAASFNDMADALAETERQRRDFIANISHELKTPMTTIAGYTDGILDGTIPPEKEKQYLQIISDESRRLSRLVRRMLDISQIQSKEMKKSEFDLCESMRLALLSMEHKILDRDLDVEAEIPDSPVMVLGDNDLLTQVTYNLLENATKFAAPQSTLYLGLSTDGEKARVTVRNLGATIPVEEIPLLFERFHKSDKSRSVDKDGYGLGLYVVKTILELHKERITVTSEDGITTFSYTVQLADGQRHERM